MNKLSKEEQVRIVACLVEGNSLRSTSRITNTHRTTIQKLLVQLGKACAEYQDKTLRNLSCERVECDEQWAFIGCKEKNVQTDEQKSKDWGDVWLWAAIDSDTKLLPSWYVGLRDETAAYLFIHDLKSRMKDRIQLTTDGLKTYLPAVESAFGADVDYAQLIKLYGTSLNSGTDNPTEVRYSPPMCIGARKKRISGSPIREYVSTSIVERLNLTSRMQMRRFTRLTNAFSKKLENHEAAIALHFMHYNFARIHTTLRCTPAMQAGVAKHVWSIEEIVGLIN